MLGELQHIEFEQKRAWENLCARPGPLQAVHNVAGLQERQQILLQLSKPLHSFDGARGLGLDECLDRTFLSSQSMSQSMLGS